MQKLLENLKKSFKTKKVKLLSIAIILLLLIGIASSLIFKEEKVTKNKQKVNSAELARAMTYNQVGEGENAVEGTDNVKFDAFFLRDLDGDGYAESIRGTCKEIGTSDTLYMELNVQTEGMLKNAKIQVNGQNFYLQTALPKDQEIKNNYIGNNVKEIQFNDMNNGTQKLLTGIVRSGSYYSDLYKSEAIGKDLSKLSRDDNKIILTGTYVAADGSETPIRKEVCFTVDWYGETRTDLYASSNTYYDLDKRIDEESQKINLVATIKVIETRNQLNISKNYVTGTIPELNGFSPIEVTSNLSELNFNYDADTRKFVIERDAEVSSDNIITSSIARTNIYTLNISYPLEAYRLMDADDIDIKIPVSAYYEGFNNPNSEFKNPFRSNMVSNTLIYYFRNEKIDVIRDTRLDITVGKYISRPNYRYIVSKQKPLKIYNGVSSEEKDDNYTVRWYTYKGTNEVTDGIVMKEVGADDFIKTDSTNITMESLSSNVGIAFSGADDFLNEDGFIKVYNDNTNELLATFNKDNWGQYTESKPYRYNLPVKNIRIETSETKNDVGLYVYNIKQLDDEYITDNFTREEFDNLQYIESNLSVIAGEKKLGEIRKTAYYEAPYSVASIRLNKTALSTQVTEKNEKITITASCDETCNQVAWKNGSFLVKLPDEILTTEINNIEINNNNIRITSYEYIENENGKFIKINTENDEPQTFDIVIDANITPDPRIATVSRMVELWATNEETVDYYYNSADIYDVNNNLNVDEKIHKTTKLISLIAPNSLLTNQTASEYDKLGTTVVSPQIADVRPPIAEVNQETEEKTIKIGVQLKNNYSNAISEVEILGKIPFEGNSYVISKESLNSEFTTKMVEGGIEVPIELQGKITVYYSENENPDRDLNKEENGWKTKEEITDWDNVKTFLVDFEDAEISAGKEYVFYYKVEIPQGVEYNKIAYSHHGVYFALNTDEGKYRTSTEPNKIGIRISEKYNLEIQKYHKGKDILVPGATYKITEEVDGDNEEKAKTIVTNEDGIANLTNLYVDRIYRIEELKVPDDYILNQDVVRFISHVNEDGSLIVETLEGNTREPLYSEKLTDDSYKIVAKLEDEARFTLRINKVEKGTEVSLRGIRYKLYEEGLSENSITVTTNRSGQVDIRGLESGKTYLLEEIKAKGYYLADPISFKINYIDGEYLVEIIDGDIKERNITEENNLPVVHFKLEDEKIPTYNLELTKIKKVTPVQEEEKTEEITYLSGAKFSLYKDSKEIGEFITDENGKLIISGLHQYNREKEKQETGEYVLKETFAPEGYTKVKDIVFKVENVDGNLEFIEKLADGQTAKKYIVEENTVKILVEDSPSFRLIKKDGETGELLANTKFAIYNVENEGVPARNSKGEIIGTKEIINNREYYTVTTNTLGEITLDLPEGMYKAVEIKADEKYDISDSTYYFGIGTSGKGKKTIIANWATGIGGNNEDKINSVIEASDGGYIVGGYFESRSIDLENGDTLSNTNSYSDGMIIKYNAEGEAEWGKTIGGTSDDAINSLEKTEDGGYIVGGYFKSSSINLENGVILDNKSSSTTYADGMIVKYSANGNVEWGKRIGGNQDDIINKVVATSDGGYLVGGHFNSESIDLGNGIILYKNSNGNNALYSDGMVIKYNAEGEVEWAKVIGGDNDDTIDSVIETADGGYIVGGKFNSISINLENGIVLNNDNNNSYYSFYDVMIIKYNSLGDIEWTKVVGGERSEYITSMSATSDGGYIVGGYFYSYYIEFENGSRIINKSSAPGSYYAGRYADGMIIKYSDSGDVEWAKSVQGGLDEEIRSVTETRDGGYIVGGYFSSVLSIADGAKSDSDDGIIMKYNANGEVEWIKGIGGSQNECISSVIEIEDGTYIAVGSFYSSSIDLGNEIELNSKGVYDGMIIKYKEKEIEGGLIKEAKKIEGSDGYEYIYSVAGTSDGGYIAGGEFSSSSICLENGIVLNNKSSHLSYYDGVIIKYNSKDELEWAKTVGGSKDEQIESIAETRAGEYILAGQFSSSSVDLENGITLNNNGKYDGMIIKYSSNGQVKWAKAVGGAGNDYINSMAVTDDGGIIVGGYFNSSSICLGNGIELNCKGNYDAMIIKYNAEGEAEWAKAIGGNNWDKINSLVQIKDGGYVVVGQFKSASAGIDLGNDVILNKTGEVIIKYNSEGKVEWAKEIGKGISNIESEMITRGKGKTISTIMSTKDGGYIVGGFFHSNIIELEKGIALNANAGSAMIIKYNNNDEIEWVRKVEGTIKSLAETIDGGYVLGGQSNIMEIDFGNGVVLENYGSYDGMVVKYNEKGEAEWAKGIGSEYVYSVAETINGQIMIGGSFASSIDFGNGVSLDGKGYYDGMILKINHQRLVSEVQELVVENKRKEMIVTTDIKEIDNIKGGSISGEDESEYERVKYGDRNTKEIVMIPDENYEIISITVNGEDYYFETNEDGKFIMPSLENITENKHIVVTYSLKDNKIVLNKVDSNTKEKLAGAKLKLDQLEERMDPEDAIGDLIANGQIYDTVDIENQEVLSRSLNANGKEVDKLNKISDVKGDLTNNGTYYFIEQDGKYIPTNSKTYQSTIGGTSGKHNTTANSYIPIDLTGKEGEYVVVVNAENSSEDGYDYGYVTITETVTAPSYSLTAGRFIYESGAVSASDYTSKLLEGGKIYYLHLGYRKDSSTDRGKDQIIINSINVYEKTTTSYNFIESDGKYIPNNLSEVNTEANSYIPIDLTNKEGRYAIVVNAETNYKGGSGCLYAILNENTIAPVYNTTDGRVIYISSTSTAKDYAIYVDGGKQYYLHLGYKHYSGTPTNVSINSVSLYKDKQVTYNFVENNGKYEPNNQGKDSTTASSYIPIDLRNYTGKYNLIVNAEIESEFSCDYGYVTLTENTTRPTYNTSAGRLIYISGNQEAQDYSTILDGGKVYYLHLGYYKNSYASFGDDKFTINSITLTPNDSELYHTEVEVNSQGQAITQIPFGKYEVTEIETPDGYSTLEEPVIIEFRANGIHEFDIENEKSGKVIVHHYIKETTTKVAEDEIFTGRIDEEYTTTPKLDIPRYELEKDEEGEYVLAENANGIYTSDDQEVIYYYEPKAIQLIVHHYIEGTETSVPLKDGTLAEDEISSASEGTPYKTDEILSELLDNRYKLVEIPENAEGVYTGDEIQVIYYYARRVGKFNIIKTDEKTGETIKDVEFGIISGTKEILDDFGEPVEESDVYIEDKIQSVESKLPDNVIGEYEPAGKYYFVENDGAYIPNNQGIPWSTAYSEVIIDLTEYKDDYVISINSEISNSEEWEYGEVELYEESEEEYFDYNSTMISISGDVEAKDYTALVKGGKRYCLSLGYYKYNPTNSGQGQFKINGINVYKVVVKREEHKYFFERTSEGKYISNNIRKNDTAAMSRVKLDLRNYEGKYKININAEISGRRDIDYGYVLLSEQEDIRDEDFVNKEIVSLTGIQNAKDYYCDIEGGKEYYLHFIYDKGDAEYEDSDILDRFIINNIEVEPVAEYYVKTDDEGKAMIMLLTGDYTIIEKNAPYLYEMSDEAKHIYVGEDGLELEITNKKKKGNVIVHHYIENTTTPVRLEDGTLAKDEYYSGEDGDIYATDYIHDLGDLYELVDIPDNASGEYVSLETEEITYYYKRMEKTITVNKIDKDDKTPIEGVEFEIVKGSYNVLTEFGELIKDVQTTENAYYFEKQEDGKYISNNSGKSDTEAVSYIDLDLTGYEGTFTLNVNAQVFGKENYDFARVILKEGHEDIRRNAGRIVYSDGVKVLEITGNAETNDYIINIEAGKEYRLYFIYTKNGNYVDLDVEDKLIINSISLEKQSLGRIVTDSEGKASITLLTGEYTLAETTVPEGYYEPENNEHIVTLGKDGAEVTIENEKKKGNVIVYHYIEGTTEYVPTEDGISESVFVRGPLNTNYETSVLENVSNDYELVRSTDNTTGIFTEEDIEVTYYYRLKDTSVLVHHYIEGTENKLSEDILIEGKAKDNYETEIAKDIPEYYELVEEPENKTGVMTGNQIIVTYYYKLKEYPYVVNYLEKDTGKVLHDQKEGKNYVYGTEILSSDEVIDIAGYNFDSADKDTLTIQVKDNVINLYYTKKDATVIVHHYKEGTIEKVANDVTVTGKVGDDYETAIAEDLPSKYELALEPANKVGTMTEEQIEVIYYYKLKSTKVIVHHYEEGTTNKLSEDVEIEGLIDSTYTTTSADDIPIKYTLVETPLNATGIMTEEVIEVTYYYAVKDAILNIYYLEKNTDIELAKPEKQTGKVGESYRTDAKEIEGYTLVENSGNTTGQLEVEPLTVIYYYLKNTRATVQYIDITTGEILDERTETGLVGDEFVTETKTFDDYILVQEPEQKTVNMTKEEIVLKYYYLHISAGVIEQHIDVISGDVLYNGTHEGNEGDEYNIPPRTFTGYDLVEDRLPANSEGTMRVDPITVTYYYIHRAKVTTQYIDKTTGEKITPDVVENGHEDDPYTTENKVFEGYKLVQVPENSNGNMTKEDTVVTYYYVRETLGVVERHLDVLTNEALVAEKQYYGYAEDPYETHEQKIPGYDLVRERYPENATGKMGVEQIVVTYYYSKKTQVQVKYVDKITGEEIAPKEVIDGHKGDNYKAEEKEITGYDLVEVPTNKEGTMTDDITEVIYYYIRPAKVIANYYDIDTKETIAAEEVIDGHEGNEYETVEKEVKYYNLVEMPQNAKGNMTAEDTRVDYYYKKKDFNLKVEKQVKEIAYNGQVLSINDNIGKVELDKNKIASTEMVVTYEIKVTNTAELKGGAELIENIPSGMTMNELDNKDWVIHEDTAILSVEDLEPGQERSYNVVMRWAPSENNLGMKENIAEIVKVDNEAGFEEITIEDNKGKADLVISIKTGAEDDNTIVKLAILAIFIVLGITVTCIILKEKNRK